MSTIYHLDGVGDPHGVEHLLQTLAEPMALDHSNYWLMPKFRGSENEFVEDLASGATLQRHWQVEDPKLAFPTLRFAFKHPPFTVPDIMVGQKCPTVSAKARDVIERLDPGQHQFHRLSIVDVNDAEWTEQELFAFVPGRQILFEDPIFDSKGRVALPRSSSVIANDGLSVVENTPGLARTIEAFPFWTGTFDQGSVYWNEACMQAMLDAGLVGIKLIERNHRSVGAVVNQIWFQELN